MLDVALHALADTRRRAAIDVLSAGPCRAGELAQRVGISASEMSKHLRLLRRAGLVEESHPEFDTRVRIYALRSEGLAALKDWLARTEAMWAHQLACFKQLVEAQE